jgi:hypothetical protein
MAGEVEQLEKKKNEATLAYAYWRQPNAINSNPKDDGVRTNNIRLIGIPST